MTLSKLAQLANVSVSVVSKAFAGKNGVSEAMREHVFAVAKEHGCFQQFYHARYDKPVIAVIIPEAISKYYIHYIETLKKDIEESGYTMLLSINNFDAQLTEDLVRYYSEHIKVDGLILVGSKLDFSFACDTALISISSPREFKTGAHIVQSLQTGVHDCIEHLYANGHRDIAYVGEPLTEGKEDFIISEMNALGLEVRKEWFISSPFRFEEAGRDGVRRLLSTNGKKPTAIIGAYGYITQGIISELTEMGFCVPNDVSVISMDNDPFPIHHLLDVSHIPSATEELCAAAMKLLHDRIRSDEPNSTQVINIDSCFVLGNSIKSLL